MDNSQSSFEIRETPSSIVRIAYRQLSIMTGMSDLTEPKVANENKLTKEEDGCMVCTRRFFRLPIFLSAASSMCYAYTTVKQSHESITTIFNSVENGLSKGAEYVSPLTNRIGETLEMPLKKVDNVVCIGLDVLEEKLPSIYPLSHEFYENMHNNIRQVCISWMKGLKDTCVILFGNSTGQADRLEASMNQKAQNGKNSNNIEKNK